MLGLLKIYAISKKVMSYIKAGDGKTVKCHNCGCEYPIDLESCPECKAIRIDALAWQD